MLTGYFFAKPILTLIRTKPELLEGAVIYFKIYMLGIPGVAIFNYGNAVLSAAGDTKRPLFYLTTAGVINIILNLIFVIVFYLSCAGVALASIISQYVSAFFVMAALFRIAWIYTVFAYFQTIPSLFLLYIFSWIITAVAEMIYFFRQYRKI